jgi:methylmalonyl-CoA/ethylmalonyl-CoA epimerase
MADHLSTNVATQVALVVRDVEKTARAFADLLGVDVPQWIITDTQDKTGATYQGQPMVGRAKLAFFDLGSLSMELIEPVGGPSVWQDFLQTKGEGVHHIAFRVKDMDAEVAMLEKKGMPAMQRGNFTGGCYAYIDSSDALGVMLELLAFKS